MSHRWGPISTSRSLAIGATSHSPMTRRSEILANAPLQVISNLSIVIYYCDRRLFVVLSGFYCQLNVHWVRRSLRNDDLVGERGAIASGRSDDHHRTGCVFHGGCEECSPLRWLVCETVARLKFTFDWRTLSFVTTRESSARWNSCSLTAVMFWINCIRDDCIYNWLAFPSPSSPHLCGRVWFITVTGCHSWIDSVVAGWAETEATFCDVGRKQQSLK